MLEVGWVSLSGCRVIGSVSLKLFQVMTLGPKLKGCADAGNT